MDETAEMGETLLADVQRRWVPENARGLWWFGQSSFAVRGAGATVCIDPTALPGIAATSPHAKIPVPGAASGKVVGMGIAAQQVVVPPPDETVAYGPLTVTAIPAAHEE